MDKLNQWNEELEMLKAIVAKADLVLTTKWGADVYTHHGKNVVSYGGFKNFFSLWFYNGVFLKDPYKVLVNAQEGKTKALRQWRFTSKEEINESRILEYINEAISNEKEGKIWKPEKNESPAIPEALEEVFNSDSTVKSAFEKLAPYKQKDYIEYITTAKRDATRVDRIQKIIPQILEGLGLHDKYKK